jgi:membrane protein required for colicin V production
MHMLDIILGIITLVFVIIGIKRGLTGEIFRIIALIAGFIVAFLYYNEITPLLGSIKIALHIKNALAFFLLYIIVALLILLIGWLVKKVINMTVFGWFDRLLGAGVGFVKALIIAWAVCLSISSFPTRNDFARSIVYTNYKKLPKNFHLTAILKTKESIRSLFELKNNKTIDKKRAETESLNK